MVGYIILALIVVLLAVILVRTAAFRPRAEETADIEPVDVDAEHAVQSLAAMVRCKTVSSTEPAEEDEKEFKKFEQLLKDRYPNIHKTCTLQKIGKRGLLYHWKGSESGDPTVLMSHFDVVPVNEDQWDKPAFEGIIENGELWGRGTLDTKGTLCGVVEASEALMAKGFTPKRDIYFSFSGNEETAGDGAPGIVDWFEKEKITPALVVDEGGAVVDNLFPGVTAPCAVIGTGEKGIMDLRFSLKSGGGHASAPPPHTLVGVLAKAVTDVESKPFPNRLSPPAAQMFDTLGRHSSFLYRMIFSNLWCFGGLLDALCRKKGGELNALMRTTVAFTQMQGSNASNVLPPSASVVANLRLMGGDDTESAIAYLKKVIKNDDIVVEKIHGQNPSRYSRTDTEGWARLKNAVKQTWPDAIVSPYLMIAASDSRHYCRISDNVMRFSAMALSGEERGRIHGNNERIPVEKIATTVAFYTRLIMHS